MSRWSFLLLGGDAGDPAVKRMMWRIGAAAFVIGFFFGFFEPESGETYTQNQRYVLAGLSLIGTLIFAYEGRRFYQYSDELTRRVLLHSQAIAFGFVIIGLLIYGVIAFIFALPNPPTLALGLGAWLVSSFCWFYAAWKAT
ncbi:MAG: hypothetical protein AAGD92_14305 [Pseudomonadota bacterium]